MITWQEVSPENGKHTGMLEDSDYAKSEFVARLSHELRTPLNVIIGFAEMLCQEVFGTLGNEKYQEYARDIHESGRHLLRLINNLLHLARIEMGRYELNRRMIDAHAVIERARRHVRMLADERAVIVAFCARLAEGMPRVYADERSLRQIIINLLSNAIRFSPIGSRMEVRAAADAVRFTVSVTDSGAGIAREDLERILRPFEWGRNIMVTEDGSLGLGLPLAKHLVELHGGALRIDSTLGSGTCVTLQMPRVPIHGAEA